MSLFPSLFGHNKDKTAASLKSQIDQVFDNFLTDWPTKSAWPENMNAFFSPAIDLAETKEGVELKADLPDMNKDDIHLELHGDHLVLSGEKHEEKEDKKDKGYHFMERSFGSFRRVIPLPFTVDDHQHINANYDKGVLSVQINRPAGEPAADKKIKING